MTKIRIYIPLLGEGTRVIRPTFGEEFGGNIFRVLPTEEYNPTTELWLFPPDTIVECSSEVWEGKRILVARKLASDHQTVD